MKDIRVVAFDCDGVMFDTARANTEYYNRVLAHLGKPGMTPEQFAYCHMQTAAASMVCLFADERERDAAEAYRRTLGYESFLRYMKPESHLKPLLEKLRPAYKTAVATNRSDTMGGLLAEFGLTEYFDLVVTALDVKYPKPHPEPLIKVLEYFSISPEQILYVGDSQVDQVAAKAAGIPLIAYDNPSLEAAFHITNLKEVEDILLGD